MRTVADSADPTQVAIGAPEAAAAHGLMVLRRGIANHAENYTRFVVLARQAVAVDLNAPCKTSLIFVSRHEQGALMRSLDVLGNSGHSMTKLESRPRPGRPWEYMFFLDFEGNVADPRTAGALDDGERSVASGRAAQDPQALSLLISHARLLIAEGRRDEALRLTDESLQAGFLPYYVAYDAAWVMHELGAESVNVPLPQTNEPWRSVVTALLQGELVDVADRLGDLGLRPDEAHTRLRAARELVGSGRRAEADEQLRRALAFYRTVGATRYVREGEALLAASA
jgi:hypothetical protein